jgi:UDP-N-acetylmuramyl pentapeptide synthase
MGCCDGTAALAGSGWVAVLCAMAGLGKRAKAAAIATGANIRRRSRRSPRIDLT